MPILLLIGALAATVWALVYLRYGSLLLCGTAFVLLGYVFTNNFWQFDVGPVSLNCARVLLVGLVLLLLCRWWQGQLPLRPLQGADWIGLLLLGYLAVRFLLTPAAPVAGASAPPGWRLVASFFMPAALYVAVRGAELTERQWRWVLGCLSGLGVYLAVTGVAEVHGHWWAVFPQFIADPDLGTHFGRARGPALLSVSLGVYLAICLWATWFLWGCAGRTQRVLLGAALVVMVVGLYYTYTRSTWLGLLAGCAVVAWWRLPRSWRPVFLTGVLGLGLVGTIAVGEQIVHLGRQDTDGSSSHSVSQRASFAYVSLRMFVDRPLWGCGFGRFYDAKLPYLSDRSQPIELESLRNLDHHNTFLSVLVETGLVGFTLFVALLLAWARAACHGVRDSQAPPWVRCQGLFALAVLTTYGVNAMFHDLTLSPNEQWLLCLSLGVTMGLLSMARRAAAAPVQHSASLPDVWQPSPRAAMEDPRAFC